MLLRVLVVVLGFQVSGLSTAAAEIVHVVSGEKAGAPEQCPLDGPCDDCPADCPNCHCANRLVSVVPELGPAPLRAFVGVRQPRETVARSVPASPDPSGLFRPPCRTLVS